MIFFYPCVDISAINGSIMTPGEVFTSTPNKPPNKKFQCDKCGKRYTSRSGLQDHQGMQHGSPRYKCSICLQGFMSKGAHAAHEMQHLNVSN